MALMKEPNDLNDLQQLEDEIAAITVKQRERSAKEKRVVRPKSDNVGTEQFERDRFLKRVLNLETKEEKKARLRRELAEVEASLKKTGTSEP